MKPVLSGPFRSGPYRIRAVFGVRVRSLGSHFYHFLYLLFFGEELEFRWIASDHYPFPHQHAFPKQVSALAVLPETQ